MEGSKTNPFDNIADEVVILILEYVPLSDICCNVSRVNKRFNQLCRVGSVVKNGNLQRCYQLDTDMMVTFLRSNHSCITRLNLTGCYWFSARVFDVIPRCVRLEELLVTHCNIATSKLTTLLSPLDKLHTLSVTLRDPRLFHIMCKTDSAFQKVLQRLRVLCLHFVQCPDLSSCINIEFCRDTTLFEHCSNLQEFHVQGFPSGRNMVPSYVLKPHIVNQNGQRQLRVLGLNSNMDVHARIFFYGYVQELCSLPLNLETLLLPMANLQHANNPQIFALLENGTNLRDLNICGTMMRMPCVRCPIDKMANLRYLNLADNVEIYGADLEKIASGCSNLVSINLQNSHNILKHGPDGSEKTVRGLQMLLWNSFRLRHLNVAGIHIRSSHDEEGRTLSDLIQHNGGLLSLAMADCCLLSNSNTATAAAEEQVESAVAFKKRRISRMPAKAARDKVAECELFKIVKSCPDLEVFELAGAGFRSGLNLRMGTTYRHTPFYICMESRRVQDENLMAIGGWKHLNTLQLSGLQGPYSAEVLVTIAQGCPQLSKLFLSHICLASRNKNLPILQTALPFFKNLVDLRIEQPGLPLGTDLFAACAFCTKLQRLCIIASASVFDNRAVYGFVAQVKSLIALQLLHGTTMEKSKKLFRSLKRLCEDRPAWSCVVYPLERQNLETALAPVPSFHLDEVVLLHHTVASKPPGWQW